MRTYAEEMRSNPLVAHVLQDNCTDPDCEIHNLDVAIEEEVVSFANVAFWLAGAYAMREFISSGLDQLLVDTKEVTHEVGIT